MLYFVFVPKKNKNATGISVTSEMRYPNLTGRCKVLSCIVSYKIAYVIGVVFSFETDRVYPEQRYGFD
jgi:hypothetical protein